MKSYDIRKTFLEFFKSKGHTVVESDTLAPKNDPTLLFTGAGMNQFKEQFIGKNITFKRACSSQKCLRTGDLDNVGKTSGHHTFFEMLGNFSFGDYFKKDACSWAWEFMTGVLKIPKEKLWISVYKDDDEAYEIWEKDIHVPKDRIVKFGAKDNFWPSNAPLDGPNGPCGPCSEIFYDWGESVGCRKKECTPACDCGRFIEVWNLVFTQFNRVGIDQLEALPSKNIDTGMGLERITSVMQGVKTNFETDLFMPIIEEIKKYKHNARTYEVNAIADHLRASVFSICDGVSPSNEERGYVVRKLIRRAYMLSKANEAFLYNIVPKIVKVMGDVYPMLKTRREDITAVVKEEEERFQNTLVTAIPKLEELIGKYKKERTIPGDEIFKLVDTYGLPLEVIEDRAKKSGYKVDKESFRQLMNRQKDLSRAKSKIEGNIFVEGIFAKAPKPGESGSDPLSASIVFIARDKESGDSVKKGDRAGILTDPQSSFFYTEAGGQVGDTGIMEKPGAKAEILNTYKMDDRVIFDCAVLEGVFNISDKVIVKCDKTRNKDIARNHTATHLLHSALRNILGEHVHQSGSLVGDTRLRFDFTHIKKLTEVEIEHVEDFVNEKIKEDIAITKETKDRTAAEKEGAMALFGEKYGDKVRVVSIKDCSKELCGGTHVDNTSEIGLFKIISESSIASGVRRIEAVTNEGVLRWMKEDIDGVLEPYEEAFGSLKNEKEAMDNRESLVKTISRIKAIKAGGSTWEEVKEYARDLRPDILEATESFAKLKKHVERQKKEKRIKDMEKNLDDIFEKSQSHNGVKLVVSRIGDTDMNVLRKAADIIKKKAKSAFIALAALKDDRVNMVVTFTDDIEKKGLNAAVIIKESAKVIGGSGGGRQDFAQAGGSDVDGIDDALETAKSLFLKGFK